MSNLNTCEITGQSGQSVYVRTAKGRLAYPYLFSPNKDGKYSASLVFPQGTDLTGLKDAVELAAKEFFGPDYAKKYPKLKRPFLNTAESPAMGVDAEAFPVFIRTSTGADPTKPKPQVIDHKRDAVTDPGEAYPGRWVRLSISVKGYDRDGNKGVTCYVNNAQLLEHADRFGSGGRPASDDFEAVDVSGDASELFKGGE